jgi:hypothetical protein
MRSLQLKKPVSDELSARKAFVAVENKMARMPPALRKQAAAMCQGVAKRYASTPTGEKAKALAEELSVVQLGN